MRRCYNVWLMIFIMTKPLTETRVVMEDSKHNLLDNPDTVSYTNLGYSDSFFNKENRYLQRTVNSTVIPTTKRPIIQKVGRKMTSSHTCTNCGTSNSSLDVAASFFTGVIFSAILSMVTTFIKNFICGLF